MNGLVDGSRVDGESPREASASAGERAADGAPSTVSTDATRARTRLLLAAVGTISLFGAIDFVVGMRHPAGALAARLLWIAGLLAALVEPRADRSRAVRFVLLNQHGFTTGVAYSLIVWAAGGSAHPYFQIVIALPFALGVLEPRRPWTTILCAASLLVGGLTILSREGQTATALGVWGAMMASMSGFAIAGAHFNLHQHARELAVEREVARKARVQVHLERLAVLGRLAAGIVHEVRSPLAVIRANADWIERETSAGCDAKELRTVAVETADATRHIEGILDDVRRFARKEASPEVAEVDVAEVLRKAIRMASIRSRLVRTEVEAPAGPIPAWGNEARLVQVVVNLLVNAAEAIEEAGHTRDGRVTVRVEAGPETVTVAVVDNGPGLPPAVLAQLFEPFATTKSGGQGLGLALSRQALEEMGGALEARNRPEGGAVFVMKLAVRRPARSIA